jgi:chitin synthase
MVEREDNDLGDMPLLRHNGPYTAAPMPGGYQEAVSDDRSETNIRYGHIPQRVPRRYKTIKKVE